MPHSGPKAPNHGCLSIRRVKKGIATAACFFLDSKQYAHACLNFVPHMLAFHLSVAAPSKGAHAALSPADRSCNRKGLFCQKSSEQPAHSTIEGTNLLCVCLFCVSNVYYFSFPKGCDKPSWSRGMGLTREAGALGLVAVDCWTFVTPVVPKMVGSKIDEDADGACTKAVAASVT